MPLCKEVALSPELNICRALRTWKLGSFQTRHVKEIQGSDYQTTHVKCRGAWKRVNMAFGMVPNSLDRWGKCFYPLSLYTLINKVKAKVRSTHWTVIPGCIVFATINQDSSRSECNDPCRVVGWGNSLICQTPISTPDVNFRHFHCKDKASSKPLHPTSGFDSPESVLICHAKGRKRQLYASAFFGSNSKDKSGQIWPQKCDRDDNKIECTTQFSWKA